MNQVFKLTGEFTGAYGSLYCGFVEALAYARSRANKYSERVRVYAEDGTKLATAQPGYYCGQCGQYVDDGAACGCGFKR